MNIATKIIGTLLPLTALKGFDAAYEFIDWLEKTNQSAWQLLPLHETQLETGSKIKHVPSPYKSYSIGLDSRYLNDSSLRGGTTKQSPSGLEQNRRLPRFARNDEGKEAFLKKHKDWVTDYALFCALRDHFGTDNWVKWDPGLVERDPKILEIWMKKLQEPVDRYITQQWQLHEHYTAMHTYALSKGIVLIGDLPYYPSFRSPLVWAHQEVFQIDTKVPLQLVSGIPNTPSAHFGRQVWGHPLYNWDHKEEYVVAFWKMRLRYLSSIFDHIRFDHAKAFFSYGVMDQANPSDDHYATGPGRKVFKSLLEYGRQQGITIFAEDSGERTKEIRAVMDEISIPGLRIFKFAMKGEHIIPRYAEIANYPENSVAYTTTHDTETLLGYLQSLSKEQKHKLSIASRITYDADDKLFAATIRNALIASKSKTVIIPLQDWLLTTDRINIPGTEKEIGDTNWQFILEKPVSDLPAKVY